MAAAAVHHLEGEAGLGNLGLEAEAAEGEGEEGEEAGEGAAPPKHPLQRRLLRGEEVEGRMTAMDWLPITVCPLLRIACVAAP